MTAVLFDNRQWELGEGPLWHPDNGPTSVAETDVKVWPEPQVILRHTAPA